ncbi:conserved hypothetical protein [Sphingorhabdus sp. 109]|nr:conserved hypothetical protein [Sphingorhabdus sp. 109]
MLLMRGEDLMGWAERARPGDTIAYARDHITPSLAAQTRPMIDAGIIIPLFTRDRGEGVYLAKRGEGRIARVKRRQAQVRNDGRFRRKPRRSIEGVLLRILRHAASHNRPCPTNRELARACNLSDDKSASYRMRCLVKAGYIAVEDHSPFGRRVITILTGKYAGMKTAEAALPMMP